MGKGTKTAIFYSALGGRQRVTDNGQITGYTANHLNQYTVVDGSTLSYDANGNLSKTVAGVLGDWSYTYDAQNRLIRATGGPSSIVAEFYYDARNRCVKRVINGVTTYLIYDGWSLLEERNLAGNLLARYYHGPVIDELLCRVTETNTVYYHHDGLGSTVALTDSTGNVVESYTYDVYGQPSFLSTTYHLLPTSAVTNRFLFTGREYLAELGLYDYRHRFYSPSLGRFMQTDPLRFDAEDVNLYQFIENSPVDFVDPDGLSMTAPGAEVWHPMAREGTPEQAKFWGNVVAPSVVLTAYTFAAAPWLLETVPLWWDKLQEILKKCPEDLKVEKGTTVQEGTKVFRVWGDEAKAWGRSWTTFDPRTVRGYRGAAALPNQNTGRFMSEGVLQNTKGITLKPADPLHGNPGGLPEVVVPNPQKQIKLQNVQGLNPEF